jgi:hypothetical protein
LLIGAIAGALAVRAWENPRRRAAEAAARAARDELAAAVTAQLRLAELQTQLSGLRHDLRGILSPAMLIADRLVSHDEPGIRRAGEVITRTVERAATRLAETKFLTDGPVAADLK